MVPRSTADGRRLGVELAIPRSRPVVFGSDLCGCRKGDSDSASVGGDVTAGTVGLERSWEPGEVGSKEGDGGENSGVANWKGSAVGFGSEEDANAG